MTKQNCIDENDYQTAISKYEKTTKRWKSYWWDCLQTIYKKCKEFAKTYILDPIAKVVIRIFKEGSNTYLVKMFDENGKHVFTKIGKANNIKSRLQQQMNHTYKDGTKVTSYEIIKTFYLPTDDLAEVLESFMRNYFKKSHKNIPNDRFEPFIPTEQDIQTFENYYKLVINNA